MTGWTWAAARRRGTSHVKSGVPCQDAIRSLTSPDGDRLIAIVSDGAGSAKRGGAGAFIAARTMAHAVESEAVTFPNLPTDEAIWCWMDRVRDLIGISANRHGLTPRDFAATMVMAVADRGGVVLALVGDGAAAIKNDGAWSIPSWPEHGEYASTTYFVTDEPQVRMRIERIERCPDAIVLMSDGLERLALDFSTKIPHAPFFDLMVKPVENSLVIGRDRRLSSSLASNLNADTVNTRTDDDKSLVVAVRR